METIAAPEDYYEGIIETVEVPRWVLESWIQYAEYLPKNESTHELYEVTSAALEE